MPTDRSGNYPDEIEYDGKDNERYAVELELHDGMNTQYFRATDCTQTPEVFRLHEEDGTLRIWPLASIFSITIRQDKSEE